MKKKKRERKKTAKPLAAVTADTHLYPITWADKPTLRGDSYWSFQQIVGYCVRYDIPRLIIAGDVMERRTNDARTPGFMREQFDILEYNVIDCIYVQGQHGLQSGGVTWPDAVHSWPKHLPERGPYMIDGSTLHGIDWTPAPELPEALSKMPESLDILVMHQVCTEFMGGVRDCELTIATLPSVKVLIIGDYHVHAKRTITNTNGDKILVLSPGSTSMQSIREEVVKHFFVLYDDYTVDSVELDTRHVISTETLITQAGVDKFVEGVGGAIHDATHASRLESMPEDLCKPIIRVDVAAELEGAARRIKKAVGSSAFLFLRSVKADREDAEVSAVLGEKVMDTMRDRGLVGFLPEVIDKEDDPSLFDFVTELLESTAPREVIARWRSKFLDAGEEVLSG
jgi:predicted phosphodiesterase